MLSIDRYKFIVSYTEGMALDAIWLYLEDDSPSYAERKADFVWMLRRMLEDGLVVLGKNGISNGQAADEVVRELEETLPLSEEQMDNGFWFLSDKCPATIGWIAGDGNVYWA
jgi:hypothetical protein